MHRRSAKWLEFARADTFDAATADGWVRLRLSLLPAGGARRSWAIDPTAAAEREWTPLALVPEPASPRGRTWRVFSSAGVEGESNPHDDTRGLVPEEYGGTRVSIDLPGSGSAARRVDLLVARSRDGIRVDLPIEPQARVYGLGERTGGLDKRGRTWTFWNSDEPLHTPGRDPLYQSIPVAYLSSSTLTTTVFSDSPATQYFDAGESDPGTLRIEAYDSRLDLYLRVDPALSEAVAAYTGLTGRMPLPPEWALGFQQCRYSYFPESRVMEVAERMRESRIPCDVIYLDIHYMDGYRVFTWDPARFPDPARMIEALRQRGFHVVTIVDPGVKVDPDYPVYLDGISRGVFLKRSDELPYVGRVWPGESVFPDFSDRNAREFWSGHLRALLEPGVDGIWNDMNEPADFSGDSVHRPDFTVPDDLIAENDGARVGFGRVHNAFANGMNEATREAFASQRPDDRGFVLTRAGYAGIQRFAAVWTGDNHSWWEHLAMVIPMALNLGLSGVPFNGPDTAGFQENASAELFVRWVEAASLMPFFRAHTALDTLDHEPWSFGPDVLSVVRRHIEVRYQLLPYIYTLFDEAARTGAPVMRPLVWEFADDSRFVDRADCFLLGPHLLVAPVRERGVSERAVALPDGLWYDFHDGTEYHGPATIAVEAPIGRLPLFVRAGSILPYEAVRQHTGEPGDGVLRLLVAPDRDGRASGTLYADRGEGHEYASGSFRRVSLHYDGELVTVRTQDGRADGLGRWRVGRMHRVGTGLPTDGGSPCTVTDPGAHPV